MCGAGRVAPWVVSIWAIGAVALISFLTTFMHQMRVRPHGWGFDRANVIAQLNEDGMRHLVIVRYGPLYSIEHKWAYWEWVYNEADIDGAQIVWAREMNRDQNRDLLEYFSNRKIWLLELESARFSSGTRAISGRLGRECCRQWLAL